MSPNTEENKCIEIWPRGWPHYYWDPEDLRDSFDLVTLRPDEVLEVRHEVDREKIVAAEVKAGEKYRVELTDKGPGTRWWTFGSWEEVEGTRFRDWTDGGETVGEEEKGRYTMGEDPRNLALVVEKGEADFEIG